MPPLEPSLVAAHPDWIARLCAYLDMPSGDALFDLSRPHRNHPPTTGGG